MTGKNLSKMTLWRYLWRKLNNIFQRPDIVTLTACKHWCLIILYLTKPWFHDS